MHIRYSSSSKFGDNCAKCKTNISLEKLRFMLKEITPSSPLFLTKNGQEKYVIIQLQENAPLTARLTILEKLKAAKQTKSYSNKEIMKEFGL